LRAMKFACSHFMCGIRLVGGTEAPLLGTGTQNRTCIGKESAII